MSEWERDRDRGYINRGGRERGGRERDKRVGGTLGEKSNHFTPTIQYIDKTKGELNWAEELSNRY